MNKQSYCKTGLINFSWEEKKKWCCLHLFFISIMLLSVTNVMALTTVLQHKGAETAYAQLPYQFEISPNYKDNPSYIAKGKGYSLSIDETGHNLKLYTPDPNNNGQVHLTEIQMRLIGIQPNKLHATQPFSGKTNYLLGQNKSKWRQVESYSEILAKGVYPGIDLRYHSTLNQLEYDFIVAPGVDTDIIRLEFDGINNISINTRGDLVLSTEKGDLHHQKPVIYQEINGKHIDVQGSYTLYSVFNNERAGSDATLTSFQQVGFTINDYDPNYPLIIDPILNYAGYLGGSGPDQGNAIAVDESGNIYVAGTSFSSLLPVEGSYQSDLAGRSDIFIAKFNPEGNTLLFATYLGGENYDEVTSMSIDDTGHIIITGSTFSEDFPVENALQANYGGNGDAFVSKLSPDGSQLIFSSYIGGTLQDKGYGIALDEQNAIYLTGETSSEDFPTDNAFQTQQAGHTDAYIMKLNSDGTDRIYASYLGGVHYDSGRSIAVDNRGHATITGTTYSESDFPLQAPFQAQHGGRSDVFISQFSVQGDALHYSSYLGGINEEQANDIVIDSQNNAIIVGSTGDEFVFTASADDFPVKNALQSQRNGLRDGFISKVSPDGDELLFSSYLGGENTDNLNSVALDANNNIYLLGTSQSATGLPLTNPLQGALNANSSDVYLAKLDSDGSTVLFGSYFGGSKADKGFAMAVKNETIYMTGLTSSDTDFPLKNSLQPLFSGGVDDMFVAKVGTASSINLSIDSLEPEYINQGSHKLFTVQGANLSNVEISSLVSGLTIFDIVATDNSVDFRISATNSAALGDAELLFNSGSGSATANITVAPPLPSISISPAPITSLVGAEPLTLDLSLSGTDAIDHILILSSSDPDKISVSPSSVTVLAGQRYPTEQVQITSHIAGSVSLDVSSANLAAFHTSVFASENVYIPEIGENTAQSQPLGVIVTEPPAQAKLIEYGPFTAQLKVFKESTSISPTITVTPVLSPALGVSFGSVVSSVSPYAYLLGTINGEMVISGQGLNDVTGVAVIPSDGVTLGVFNIAADGKTITIPMNISAETSTGKRQVVLTTDTGQIYPEKALSDRIFIAAGLPEIDSISPIIMARSETGVLTVRGENLLGTQTISLIPSDGVTLSSNITINASGTKLSVTINVDALASVGPRTVIVTTPAGSTTSTSVAANTLTISNEAGIDINGILSPELGLIKGTTAPELPTTPINLHTHNIGINYGAALTGISPNSESITSNFVMTLQGNGLQNVDAVRAEPNDGLTIGSPTVNQDGTEVMINIAIDSDAPQTQRKIIASANGVDIVSYPAAADRFLITALQPKINDITPNTILKGGASVSVTVRGQYLNNAERVLISPANNIIIGTPVVNSEGTRLTVTITAEQAATDGPHLLTVVTPGGQTSSDIVPTNTLTVISDAIQIMPVYASPLGIRKEIIISAPPTITQFHTAPLLGIEKQFSPAVLSHIVPLQSEQLGVTLGTVANKVTPTVLAVDSTTALTINGVGLDKVESISFNPNEGITQIGAFSVSSDKTTIALPIEIAAGASQTLRQIILHTVDGTIPFVGLNTNRLQLVDNIDPQISSLVPIQQIAGSTFSLTIHGENLSHVNAVEISPAADITLGSPTVSADGTQLTVQMAIATNATFGSRLITVHTTAGSSSSEPSVANTFSVEN